MRRTGKIISAVMLLALALSAPTPVSVFSQHHVEDASTSQARLIEGLGDLHHAVTTKNPEAQRWFDQGLSLVYAFNHEEAIRSFKHAAELDPNLAMAHWGAALALGPNYNADVDREREKAAYEEIQKAVALEPEVSVHERAYIKALSVRYTDTSNPDISKLAHAYSAAMRGVARRYPNDPDAGVLYAESMMDLNPWKLWSLDGTPAAGTLEIVSTLESVLKKFPQHIGANHLYIHAVEASPDPEHALPSARRLAALSPSAGHLVHMPAHIFIRTGDYNASTLSNMAAAAVDRSYIAAGAAGPMYPLMYYSHNLQFLIVSSAIQGNFARAVKAVDELEKNVQQRGSAMPLMADWTGSSRALILVRFARWDEVLNLTEPNKFLPITHALYHFARGVALAGTGKLSEAGSELDLLSKEGDAMAPDLTLGFNSAKALVSIAAGSLDARIRLAKRDYEGAIASLQAALKVEDSLAYDEPPDWFLPVREILGRALFEDGQYSSAAAVFRKELSRHPNSGRSLFGLSKALKSQKKFAEARRAHAQFLASWKYADTKLTVAEL